jgi:hypothetical protein
VRWDLLAVDRSGIGAVLEQPYALLLAGALVGFGSSYVLELVKARMAPTRRLAWDVQVDTRPDPADVQVTYRGQQVDEPVFIRYRVTNIGSLVVRNQLVRFAVASGARLIDAFVAPATRPENDVSDVTAADNCPGERAYRIGYLEPGESVEFVMVGGGGRAADWTGVHGKNEEHDDVVFQRQDPARITADATQLAPFLTLFGLFAISVLLTVALGQFADLAVVPALLAVFFGVMALPRLGPAMRTVANVIVRDRRRPT